VGSTPTTQSIFCQSGYLRYYFEFDFGYWRTNSAATTTLVYAQTTSPPQPTTTPLSELIPPHIGPGGEFVQPIIMQQQQMCQTDGADIPTQCVNLVYASGNIVVLEGDLLLELQVNRNFNNDYIWQVIEQIKTQDYAIQSVSVLGAGTETNPSRLYVVMAK
jgi:hypothetical protein